MGPFHHVGKGEYDRNGGVQKRKIDKKYVFIQKFLESPTQNGINTWRDDNNVFDIFILGYYVTPSGPSKLGNVWGFFC